MRFRITERTDAKEVTVEDGWIRNVRLCGHTSTNGNVYLPEALSGSTGLYEGRSVYVNHRKGARLAEDRWAKIHAPRYVPGDGSRCDLAVLESHPMTARVKEDLARGLNFFGLSHVVDCRGTKEQGKRTVEAIMKVDSVDLVTDPASVLSLSEQDDGEGDGAAGGGDPFVAAVTHLLADSSIDKDTLLTKIGELYDTLRGAAPAVAPAPAMPAEAPASEQAMRAELLAIQEQVKAIMAAGAPSLADEVKALREQVAALTAKPAAPKKYTAPRAAETRVAEQKTAPTPAPAIPAESKAVGAWLKGA